MGATTARNTPIVSAARIMANVEELARALDYPWEKWTVFLHPDQRVKDTRTGYYVGSFQSVLDGNTLQGFLDAYLRWRVGQEVPSN